MYYPLYLILLSFLSVGPLVMEVDLYVESFANIAEANMVGAFPLVFAAFFYFFLRSRFCRFPLDYLRENKVRLSNNVYKSDCLKYHIYV